MRLFANPLAIYFAVVGFALFAAGLALMVARLRLAGGQRAQGQIIGYQKRMRERLGAKRQYMPLVRYRPAGGSPVEFQSRMGSTSKPFQIGETVAVLYRSDKPEVAEIASTPRLWLAPIVIVGMAVVSFYASWKAGAAH
ncbi:hypothetical protein GCM10022276_28820 [Sphingomonas limnosediminicola]|uniref:DUF3592 domain-containing protein n=1 Tax=Sphingomonas limnosediminicola TaxID=940133 RepID=A0ABP7LW55_9SPHN